MPDTDDNSASLSFFKRKSSSILNQIVNLKALLTADYLKDLDEAGVTVRLELLDRLQKNFEDVQDGLEHENLDEISSDARANFSANYVDVKTVLTRQLKSFHPASPQQSSTRHFSLDEPQQSIIIAQPRSRLPLLVIPEFSGDSKEWPNFYSMFQSVVGSESDLTKTEKFQHLLSRLRKPASDTVALLDINDANYDIALEMLNRYDNKRLNFQAHIRGIFALHNVESGDVSKLRELSDKVNAHIRALQTMGTKEQLADCLLIHLIGHKLDVASQTKWEEQTAVNTIPTWKSMKDFLEKRCQMLENVEYAVVTNTPSKEVSKKSVQYISDSRRVFVASSSSDSANACVFCNLNDHVLQTCPQFADLSPASRYKEAKRMHLCLNCLKKGHMVKDCKSGYCRYCQLKHNSLLHLPSVSPPPNIEPINQQSQSGSSLISTSHCGSQPESSQLAKNCVFIATAVVLVKNLAGSMIPCRAILDSASQLNCITNRFASQLGLRRTKSTTIISGIGESNLVCNEAAEIVMESRLGDFKTSFNAIIVPTITDNQPSSTVANVNWNIPSNVVLADPHFFRSQRIDILIGAGLFFEIMCVGQIRLKGNLPLLQKTRLGWIVSGGGTHNTSCTQISSCLTVVQNVPADNIADSCLHDLVSRFWEVEDCNFTASKASKEELECERHFVENHIRLKTGQYSVQLPTKMCPSKLGESYQQALRRFKNLEKRLQTRPEIKRQYSEFINEYAELKHMSEVKSFPPGSSRFFLPHHCVLKEDSTTTKLRVVFDGSAVSSSGYSLNDILYAGPTIQPKLFNILLRFRSFKIALTADICKMYRCVLVSLPDSYLQCILWRDDPKDPIRIYKLDTVTYGTKPAAFLSIRAMHQLAADEEKTYPIGSEIVRRDFYVDDMISGGNTEEEVAEIMKQTTSLLGNGHFKLRKWCSNDSKVIAEVPEADREQFLKFHDGSDITKTLGLVWDPNSDNFLFSSIPFSNTDKITKRTVLKFVARFYDPLGLIGPIITKAKIFLQLLWKENLKWDESLPQWLQSAWLQLSAEFQLVDSFTFSRFIFHNNTYLELHAFCDASLAAYGVCIYVRAECNGITETHLLCSKSRVAPLKTISVPKLELSAAMLLAELIGSIREMNIVRGQFFCWTDSTVVLSWLREEPSNFAVFVANRVSKIQSLTNDMNWCYVPSALNPADILSKGATPKELQK